MASYVYSFFTNTLPRVMRGRSSRDTTDRGVAASLESGFDRHQSSPLLSGVNDALWRLHKPKDVKTLIQLLTKGHLSAHVNEIDESCGRAPIHSIIQHFTRDRHLTVDMLVALLTYSDADVNLSDSDGRTPLHIAVELESVECVKVLLTFGADTSCTDREERTPLDVATINRKPVFLKSIVKRQSSGASWTFISTDPDQQPQSLSEEIESGTLYSEVGQLLMSVGARHADCNTSPELARKDLNQEDIDTPFSGGFTLNLDDAESEGETEREEGGRGEGRENGVNMKPGHRRELMKIMSGYDLTARERRINYQLGPATRRLYREMEDNINQRTNIMMSLDCVDEVISIQLQRKEMARYGATGARILCLDGGGMKGLVEIEVLHQLEVMTGKSIPELFDWVVATSTGAIIILGMLYAKKTLKEIRQLYFRLKDDVFASPRFGLSYNTEALERLLIDIFGTEMTLEHDRENMPKVIITAVNKKNKNPEIQYFNNCLDDDLCKTPVWKVARCSSAAPMFFSEFEDHVDGGVLANNPCQVGLTKIENYHWNRQEKLPISLVVSVGSGIYPEEQLGSINAQQYLYFGTHWLRLKDTLHEIKNLAELLSNALVESETVAHTTESQCRERGILFYRVSPKLDDIIAASETSNEKLCHMVVCTRARCRQQIAQIVRTLTRGPDDVK